MGFGGVVSECGVLAEVGGSGFGAYVGLKGVGVVYRFRV